jgi:hypothetical protein
MPIGCFLDKTNQPSEEEIRHALGPAFPCWEKLIRFIEENYQMPGEMNYGGSKYGWNLWYRKSGKSLVSLYPQQGHFIAQVVLGKDQVEKAMVLSLGEKVGKMLRETPQFHDGKWLFIPVDTDRDVEDIQQLFLLKKRPLKK